MILANCSEELQIPGSFRGNLIFRQYFFGFFVRMENRVFWFIYFQLSSYGEQLNSAVRYCSSTLCQNLTQKVLLFLFYNLNTLNKINVMNEIMKFFPIDMVAAKNFQIILFLVVCKANPETKDGENPTRIE